MRTHNLKITRVGKCRCLDDEDCMEIDLLKRNPTMSCTVCSVAHSATHCNFRTSLETLVEVLEQAHARTTQIKTRCCT